ncbi:hypothetical protein CPAST_c29890 [Clostridium pasteurianum DSM 525 = ATCC 6013]|uniref:DUF3862 domain-containing protein n=2 Tax=Clostridium pasteurianum TaxID=1501 RepID=A0A0H3JB38_CLOPA|nr:DUF3862 domain-containing protein [Clostridium pasteurianum]AJA49055.1 hypothetical protein CPAST_c29890 [Clostridium pasteurianum DSM 525 = ATCC 6013]AJA53043.1 hypothetical protein CLPA_c29890 [Clostridium pasteurianum DSM 525 = ATCC 6013]AOZ76259.1 hypothetical protein AQ983_14540 [Clostridium pasteurianum DSM 525 = ATCC 6013]ELP58993.1 hypothetical protein F502_10906 [Clostridium pasteurianum DSM 525 = ATCC 6013]KRU10949.1 Protein of unknown function DUF3862 [Clostridium pasteurianum DS
MNNRTKKCPYCTKDIPIDTKICPRCGMKQKRSFNFSNFRIILSIIPIGISVFFALHNMGVFKGKSENISSNSYNYDNNKNYDNNDKVENRKYTMEKFMEIKMGMTYDKVQKILGEGEEESSSGHFSNEAADYKWENSDETGIYISFLNNKVIDKSQVDLESKNAKVTKNMYDRLKTNMTYSEVKSILGKGELSYESMEEDYSAETYIWTNEDESYLNVNFIDGKLESKKQYDLK